MKAKVVKKQTGRVSKVSRSKKVQSANSARTALSSGAVSTTDKEKSSFFDVASRTKEWNDMSHLSIKRFQDDDPSLTAGAKRNRALTPYVAVAEKDPSGRSKCKLCGSLIPKGKLRLGLMLECHKGYRMLCTLHESCFWKHPESRKLDEFHEIFFRPNVEATKKSQMETELEAWSAKLKTASDYSVQI
jgi:hypothetical protein